MRSASAGDASPMREKRRGEARERGPPNKIHRAIKVSLSFLLRRRRNEHREEGKKSQRKRRELRERREGKEGGRAESREREKRSSEDENLRTN